MSGDLFAGSGACAPVNIRAALEHSLRGEHEEAMELLKPFFFAGSTGMLTLFAGIAEVTAGCIRRMVPEGEVISLAPLVNGGAGDVRDLEPPERLAAQFASAWVSGDQETARYLFQAAHNPDDLGASGQIVCDAMWIMFAQAAGFLRADRGLLGPQG